MHRGRVKELLGREEAGGEILVQGWVKTRRSSKSVSFVQVNDGSMRWTPKFGQVAKRESRS